MKRILTTISILMITHMVVSAQIRSNRDLLGKWQGSEKGEELRLEFFSNSKVLITAPGGRLPLASYTADFNKMPIQVSLTATDNGQQMTFKGQLEFLNNETIKFTYFGDHTRRDAFSEGRTVTMKKIK